MIYLLGKVNINLSILEELSSNIPEIVIFGIDNRIWLLTGKPVNDCSKDKMDPLPKILFAIFLINSILWVLKRIFPEYALKIRFKIFELVGVSIYIIFTTVRDLVRLILVYISTPYLYFWGYYYYLSIAGAVVMSLFFIMLLMGLVLLKVSDEKINQKPKLDESNKNILIQKIQEGIIFGIINKVFLAVAWTKTFNFLKINIDSHIENIIIAMLYCLTAITIIYSVIKAKRKTIQSSFEKVH
ncbi:MAG: hypothetical protein GF401_00015 [Chitinivibrionales bacterium]|nr:hypothetical protein [Chitinivibrionales bacterium]